MPSVAESQLRRARAELESDLRAGRDRRAETLLATYPAIADDTDAVLELVYTEFVVRQQLGQEPDPSSWLDRFPQWRADLEQMFQVHDAVCKEEAGRRSLGDASTLPGFTAAGGPPLPFAGYEVLGELGRGGMGVVYRARQVSVNRVVALKLILSGAHAGPKERERFRREVEAAARLDHPNIVKVFEVGEHEGRPFCAMEFVDGGNLADRLKGTPWPARPAVALTAAVARAADHAHQRGVVHRDLKPANILLQKQEVRSQKSEVRDQTGRADLCSLTSDLCPKVADFGLAKSLTDSDPGPTRTGDLLGTPAYMTPEQAEGRQSRVGPAADVWAVGVVLYELLAGHPPFQGESGTETLRQVRMTDPVPPRWVRPDLPRDLDTICLKCLEKDPGKRYATAGELADDLERWLRGEPVTARPVGPAGRFTRWCRRNPRVAALSGTVAALLVAAVALGVAAVVNLDDARTQAGKLAGREREARERAEEDVRREEAGRQKEAADRVRERQQVARLLAAAAARRLDDGDVTGAAVSFAAAMEAEPDPAAAAAHHRRVAALLAICPRVVRTFRVPTIPGRPVRLTSDGSRVLTFTPAGDPQVWEVATGAPLPALPGPRAESGRASGTNPAAVEVPEGLTTDGRVWAALGNDGKLRAWDAATGQPKALPLKPGEGVFDDHFSPDGGRYVAVAADGRSRQLRTAAGDAVGEPLAGTDGHYWHAFSPNGKWLATWGPQSPARVWDAATSREAARLDHPGHVRRVAFSRDGRRVATGGDDGIARLWDTAGWKPLRFHLPHGPAVHVVAFSPDGGRVLTADLDGGGKLWDAATGRAVGGRVALGGLVTTVRFSPDGGAFAAGTYRAARAWDAATGIPLTAPLPHAQYATAAFAPGGRLVTAGGDGVVQVWENPAPPAPLVRHNRPVTVAEWVLGGRAVLTGGGSGGLIVWDPADGTLLRPLPHPAAVSSAAVSPDGRRAVTAAADGYARVWDLETGTQLGDPIAHPLVFTVAFPTDDRVATAGRNGEVWLWDLGSRAKVGAVPVAGVVTSMQFVHNGRRVLVRTTDLALLDVSTGRAVVEFPPDLAGRPGGPPVVLSADGRLVGGATEAGRVRFYRTEDGAADGPEVDVGAGVTDFALSTDGARFAVREPYADGVQVWDRATGQRVGLPLAGPTPPRRVLFSPDGRAVLTVERDALRLTEVGTGLPLSPPLPVGESVLNLKLSPDGRRLLATGVGELPTGKGAPARVWDLGPEPRPRDVLAAEARFLAGRKLDDRGQLVPLTPAEADGLWERLRPRD
jgi:WD40 repeat protein